MILMGTMRITFASNIPIHIASRAPDHIGNVLNIVTSTKNKLTSSIRIAECFALDIGISRRIPEV